MYFLDLLVVKNCELVLLDFTVLLSLLKQKVVASRGVIVLVRVYTLEHVVLFKV